VDTAKETARTVKDVATERVKSEASDVMPELKETARDVVDTVKESAGRIAQETKQAVKDTAKAATKSTGGTPSRNI
jgi:gas vesicle protein